MNTSRIIPIARGYCSIFLDSIYLEHTTSLYLPKAFYSSGKTFEQHRTSLKAKKLQEIKPVTQPKIRQSLQAGQPTVKTHPHLIKQDEITPGISKSEYGERRRKLMELIIRTSTKGQQHVLIMPGFAKKFKIDIIPYPFRQDTDMLYLSGCNEPNCILVLHTVPSTTNSSELRFKSVMFTPSLDPGQAVWDGPRTCPSGACEVFNVDAGLETTELPQYLHSLEQSIGVPNVWYHYMSPPHAETHNQLQEWFSQSHTGRALNMSTPRPLLHQLRLEKSQAEIDLMRKTCAITSSAIKKTMKGYLAPVLEHHLYASVDYHSRLQGASELAYPPVVAGGSRANAIHYINNNNVVQPGELVLMDAGAEYHGYSGDITRTWPVSGKYSDGQRELYEALLYVQKDLIQACSDRPSLDHLYSLMVSKLGSVLKELHILPRDMSYSHVPRAVFGFCPHHVSHYLGMDVHDTPLISRNKSVKENAIITIEPGIYISPHSTSAPECFRGLAMRIEDDVLITPTGVEVLSLCPKEVDEIESIVGLDVR